MAIEAPFIINEDGGKKKKAGEEIYEGMPVALDANGELVQATGAMKVYGLSKLDSNANRDFAFGEFGAFGSGQLTVITRGHCEVSHSVYNKVEVDTQTSTGSSPITKKLFDDAQTYVPMQPLYTDATGLITNVKGANGASLLGKCLKPLAAGLSGPLTLELDPSASHTAADLG